LQTAAITMLPVLYSFRRCPYAIRARLALAASAQEFEQREILLRDKPCALLEASAKGTVPVLVLQGGEVIAESLDIMLWALSRNDPQDWLLPKQGSLDAMLALIAACDGDFKQQLDAYKYPQNQATAASARAKAAEFLSVLDQRLRAAAYLFGATFCLADAAIVPFVRQFAAVQPNWFAAQPWQALQDWLDTITSSTLFEGVMVKTAVWRPNPD
jgi:glutathione S-transferase